MSISSVGFPETLVRGIKACGYSKLTPIQQAALPVIRQGGDVIASAQTGTGKTAAFALPMLERAANGQYPSDQIACLVLTPTRELAQQVYQNFSQLNQFIGADIAQVYGGAGFAGQAQALKTAQIVIATPGRLLEHVQQQNIQLSQLQTLVLDEADRLLDMGFLTAIEQIVAGAKHLKQRLLFSATYSEPVKKLAHQILTNPKVVASHKQNTTAGKVKQQVYWVSETRKRELLSEIIGVNNWHQVLVFAGTKESANQLAKELQLDGLKTVVCHGDVAQGSRNKALASFVEGQARVMVATDVAARGLDIEKLPYVVNYHLPFKAEDYVHRIGRTGRAGEQGVAISLVSPKDEKFLMEIERFIKRRFERLVLPGYEFDLATEPRINKEKVSSKPETGLNRYQATQKKNQAVAQKRAQAKVKKANKKAKTGNKKR